MVLNESPPVGFTREYHSITNHSATTALMSTINFEDPYIIGEVAPVEIEEPEHLLFITRLTPGLRDRLVEKMDEAAEAAESNGSGGALVLKEREQEVFQSPHLSGCFFTLPDFAFDEKVAELEGLSGDTVTLQVRQFTLEELGYETRARHLKNQNQPPLFEEEEGSASGQDIPADGQEEISEEVELHTHPLEENVPEFPFEYANGVVSVARGRLRFTSESVSISVEVGGEHLPTVGWRSYRRFQMGRLSRRSIES